ncbi:hypothetical protein NS183_07510 [Microbacterium testaceum]|nr:hypothetical protein NS183_07510 [Microbacterium testaceum]
MRAIVAAMNSSAIDSCRVVVETGARREPAATLAATASATATMICAETHQTASIQRPRIVSTMAAVMRTAAPTAAPCSRRGGTRSVAVAAAVARAAPP